MKHASFGAGPLGRRKVVAMLSAGAAALAMRGCSPRSAQRVVLYSSADDPLVREVVAAFTAAKGIEVACVGDTEATKTTGLVIRLGAEKSSPRADVWWSSEVLGSVKLASEGVLEPYRSPEILNPAGSVAWPQGTFAPDFAWTGFASRARVVAYNTKKVPTPPEGWTFRHLMMAPAGLRVGMARPQFGTTRSHIAALVAQFGSTPVANMLKAGRENGLRLYDSNSGIVRAIAQGEIDAGLTDSDDALAARRERWPVGFVYEVAEPDPLVGTLRGIGPLVLPNSVALIKGCPNPSGGKQLVDFLLSAACERLIARSESANAPIRPALASEFPDLTPPSPWIVDWTKVAQAVPEAMLICDQTLAGM